MLRAFGDSRTPLYFVLLATALAAALGPLIAGLGMGVDGAAWAIVLAQATAFLYGLAYLARRPDRYPSRPRTPGLAEFRTIFALGIPSGVQMIVIYAGSAVIVSLVNAFGDTVVAGFGAAQRLDNIILLPAVALGMAVNTMAAQNIGADQWPRVATITRVGVLLTWAEPLVRLFIQDEASVAFGVSCLRTIAGFYPFIGLNFIFNGVVRGAGAMFQVLALNVIVALMSALGLFGALCAALVPRPHRILVRVVLSYAVLEGLRGQDAGTLAIAPGRLPFVDTNQHGRSTIES